jgi:secretion/DNA translocation related TadE-like protein
MTRDRGRGSRGSATVAMMAAIGLIAVATMVALALGFATATRHQAVAAADAAALAAAAAAIDGPASACARGRDLASRNGGQLVGCIVVDAIADVKIEVRPPGVLAVFGPVVARARAGPASAH